MPLQCIRVYFISKNSNTLEIEHRLSDSPVIIPRYRFNFRSTYQDLPEKPIPRIPGHFVNKHQILIYVIDHFKHFNMKKTKKLNPASWKYIRRVLSSTFKDNNKCFIY